MDVSEAVAKNLFEYLLMHLNPERTGFIFAAKSGPLRVSGWLLMSPGLAFFFNSKIQLAFFAKV